MEDTVWLQRPNEEVPWGFRLQGGRDFQQPLTVQKVTSGSIAANSLNSGDVIVRIGDADTASLTHAQAMSQIKNCGNALELVIARGGVHPGINSPKVGNYNVQHPPDTLHDFPKSMAGGWPQTFTDTNANESPRIASHNPRFAQTDSDNKWQPKPGFGRQFSGSSTPNTAHNFDGTEPPVMSRNVYNQGYAALPNVIIGTSIEEQAPPTDHDTVTNPPPAPPPPPPLSSPSSTPRTWNNPTGQPKIQQRSYQDSSNDYSSSYPFGAPSNYSSDSGFGQGSPVTNGQQTVFGGGSGGIYGGDYDYSDTAGQQSQQKQKTPTTPQKMPDAVLNMAARGGSDKKPFSYIADVNDIKEHRDRVRKKTPVSTLPKYQHVLNLPSFEDTPRARGAQKIPATPPIHNSDSGEAVVANLQFNSPLQLYSNDNVVEALKGQTGGVVSDVVGLSKKDKSDFTQSPVYKMIHGIDQPKPKPVVKFAEAQPAASENVGGAEIDTTSIRGNVSGDNFDPSAYDEKSIRYTGRNIPSKSFRLLQSMTGGPGGDSTPPNVRRQIREPSSDDELRFSGVNRSEGPSKAFQRLQIRTGSARSSPAPGTPGTPQGGSEIDRTSIRQNLQLGDDLQDQGEYEQSSIRYTGRNIPSKSFRMLQSLTGGPDPASAPPPSGPHPRRQQQRRPLHHESDGGDRQNPDEPVDIRYVGGHIPSKSFSMLQHSIGANESTAQDNVEGGRTDTLASAQGRKVKVVRLRSQASQEDSGSTDF